ncbi:MAG: hypothetical protein U0235_30695 [Polyangiaceae bacterium]
MRDRLGRDARLEGVVEVEVVEIEAAVAIAVGRADGEPLVLEREGHERELHRLVVGGEALHPVDQDVVGEEPDDRAKAGGRLGGRGEPDLTHTCPLDVERLGCRRDHGRILNHT